MPCARSVPMFWPLTMTDPVLGRSMAAISFSSVLLPAPEGPVMNTISPVAMFSVISASASCPPA